MLQQTRVAAVLDHYVRFLRRFPTVQSLAAARESSVLTAWSGLGYYHRARRMHRAAKLIAREGGRFPTTTGEWAELPGIGRYTAAAIASICFGEPVAAVDGNVERVVDRVFGRAQGNKAVSARAQQLLDPQRPGDFNQAMMELGATICTPRAPQCMVCPVSAFCRTRGAQRPVPQAKRRSRRVFLALVRKNASTLLVRRPMDASLMAGMWELPEMPSARVNGALPLLRLRHSITITDYHVAVFAASPEQLQDCAARGRWFTRRQYERLPLTGLTRKVLRRLPPAPREGPAESICF